MLFSILAALSEDLRASVWILSLSKWKQFISDINEIARHVQSSHSRAASVIVEDAREGFQSYTASDYPGPLCDVHVDCLDRKHWGKEESSVNGRSLGAKDVCWIGLHVA